MTTDDREPVNLIEQALVRIRRAQQSRRLQQRASQGDPAAASAATAARFRYLDALDGATEGLAISQIADTIDVDRPRASRLTAELLADDLIERGPSPKDSRYARITLTAKGQEVIDRVHASRRQNVAEALTDFTDEEAQALATLLDRFITAWTREHPPT